MGDGTGSGSGPGATGGTPGASTAGVGRSSAEGGGGGGAGAAASAGAAAAKASADAGAKAATSTSNTADKAAKDAAAKATTGNMGSGAKTSAGAAAAAAKGAAAKSAAAGLTGNKAGQASPGAGAGAAAAAAKAAAAGGLAKAAAAQGANLGVGASKTGPNAAAAAAANRAGLNALGVGNTQSGPNAAAAAAANQAAKMGALGPSFGASPMGRMGPGLKEGETPATAPGDQGHPMNSYSMGDSPSFVGFGQKIGGGPFGMPGLLSAPDLAGPKPGLGIPRGVSPQNIGLTSAAIAEQAKALPWGVGESSGKLRAGFFKNAAEAAAFRESVRTAPTTPATITEKMAAAFSPIAKDTKTVTAPVSGAQFAVRPDVAPNFQTMVNTYEKLGGLIGMPQVGASKKSGLIGGTFVRGNPSFHPSGLAADINQATRTSRRVGGTTLSQDQENAVANYSGLFPGSRFAERGWSPDVGHFEASNAKAAAAARAMMGGATTPTSSSVGTRQGIQSGTGGYGTGTTPTGNFGALNREGSTAAPPGAPASDDALGLAAAIALNENKTIRNPDGTLNREAMNMTLGSMVARAAEAGSLEAAVMDPGAYSSTSPRYGNVRPGTPQTARLTNNKDFQSVKDTLSAMVTGQVANPMGPNTDFSNLHLTTGPWGQKHSSKATIARDKAFAADPGAVTFKDARDPTQQHTYGTRAGTMAMADFVGSPGFAPHAEAQARAARARGAGAVAGPSIADQNAAAAAALPGLGLPRQSGNLALPGMEGPSVASAPSPLGNIGIQAGSLPPGGISRPQSRVGAPNVMGPQAGLNPGTPSAMDTGRTLAGMLSGALNPGTPGQMNAPSAPANTGIPASPSRMAGAPPAGPASTAMTSPDTLSAFMAGIGLTPSTASQSVQAGRAQAIANQNISAMVNRDAMASQPAKPSTAAQSVDAAQQQAFAAQDVARMVNRATKTNMAAIPETAERPKPGLVPGQLPSITPPMTAERPKPGLVPGQLPATSSTPMSGLPSNPAMTAENQGVMTGTGFFAQANEIGNIESRMRQIAKDLGFQFSDFRNWMATPERLAKHNISSLVKNKDGWAITFTDGSKVQTRANGSWSATNPGLPGMVASGNLSNPRVGASVPIGGDLSRLADANLVGPTMAKPGNPIGPMSGIPGMPTPGFAPNLTNPPVNNFATPSPSAPTPSVQAPAPAPMPNMERPSHFGPPTRPNLNGFPNTTISGMPGGGPMASGVNTTGMREPMPQFAMGGAGPAPSAGGGEQTPSLPAMTPEQAQATLDGIKNGTLGAGLSPEALQIVMMQLQGIINSVAPPSTPTTAVGGVRG